jgi:hypothetical protein
LTAGLPEGYRPVFFTLSGGRTMRTCVTLCTLLITLATAAAPAAEPKTDAKTDNKLVGTWKLVSAKYGDHEFKFPDGSTHIKHVTPTQFMWATYDKDGTVTRAAGGSYTLNGETYEETPGVRDQRGF